jgi:hypothetical protein
MNFFVRESLLNRAVVHVTANMKKCSFECKYQVFGVQLIHIKEIFMQYFSICSRWFFVWFDDWEIANVIWFNDRKTENEPAERDLYQVFRTRINQLSDAAVYFFYLYILVFFSGNRLHIVRNHHRRKQKNGIDLRESQWKYMDIVCIIPQ